MRGRVFIALIVGSLVLGAAGVTSAGEFVPLFDGKTLEGWNTAPGGNWEVKDGVIVGTSPKTERRHGMLLSDKKFDELQSAQAKQRLSKEMVDKINAELGYEAVVAIRFNSFAIQ